MYEVNAVWLSELEDWVREGWRPFGLEREGGRMVAHIGRGPWMRVMARLQRWRGRLTRHPGSVAR